MPDLGGLTNYYNSSRFEERMALESLFRKTKSKYRKEQDLHTRLLEKKKKYHEVRLQVNQCAEQILKCPCLGETMSIEERALEGVLADKLIGLLKKLRHYPKKILDIQNRYYRANQKYLNLREEYLRKGKRVEASDLLPALPAIAP